MINRRQFLLKLGAAVPAAPVLLEQLDALARPLRPLHVVIVGAGVAGLCAAYELEKRGHTTTLLEAEKEYIGGRVRTLHFGHGQYGEAGAMRIPASHDLTRRYIQQFGLPLRRFVEFNPQAFYFVHGHRERIKNVRRLDPRYAVQGIGVGEHSIWTETFHEIVGGMDRLPKAFADRLHSKPRCGCQVIRLEQDLRRGRAAAIYQQGGAQYRAEGDYLLCTLPLPILKRLEIHPSLPESKRHAISQFRYESASKALLLTSNRFWETGSGIYGGATYTDLPTGSAYYPSDNARARDRHISAGPGVLLASYSLGAAARRLDSLTPGEFSALAVRSLGHVHPELTHRGTVLHAEAWQWDHHPWSRSAFAAHGQDAALVREVRTPEGRIHFAGEHTSAHPTWIQGALESALRAVGEILHLARS